MENEELIKSAVDRYSITWKKQEKIFKSVNEFNPYPSPEEIVIEQLTIDEKNIIIKTLKTPESQAFRQISDIAVTKFGENHFKNTTFSEAILKLKFNIFNKIPTKDTCSLDSFFFSIPAKLGISKEELEYFYKNGYIPHLYLNNGKPRFDSRMWFILDFNIREAKNKFGIGFKNNLNLWKPNPHILKQYLDLTLFMYNSWNLGDTILKYGDKKARESGLKNEDFRIFMSGLNKSLWVNEGKIIANEVLKQCQLLQQPINLLNYYRDIFAILSFEAFPVSFLIDIYHSRKQRMAVMFSYEEFARVSVHNMGIGDINTYMDENLSMKYTLLFSAVEWAISMSEGKESQKITDIISLFRSKNDRHDGEIPCKICGELFKPKRPKYDVTCGKKFCILENKKISKRKNSWSLPPIV